MWINGAFFLPQPEPWVDDPVLAWETWAHTRLFDRRFALPVVLEV